MKIRIFTLIKILLGLFILSLIIFKVGIDDILLTILQLNLVFMPVIGLSYALGFFIGAYNIKLFTDQLKIIPFRNIFKHYLLSWSIGLFIPGKIGEFSLIYLLKKDGFSNAEGTVVSLLDKAITFFVLVALSIFGFFIYFTSKQSLFLIALILGIFFVGIFFFVTQLGRSIIKKFILGKYSNVFTGFSNTLMFFLKKRFMIIILNTFLTLMKWSINAYVMYLLFLALGADVAFITVLLVSSMVQIISLIPISISGLGIREGATVALFSSINILPEMAASVALLYTFANYLISGTVFLIHRSR